MRLSNRPLVDKEDLSGELQQGEKTKLNHWRAFHLYFCYNLESGNKLNLCECNYSKKGGHSLVAQMIKNLSAVQKTWVQSLGWGNSLEKGMATHPCILAWRIPWTGSWQATVHWVAKSQTRSHTIYPTNSSEIWKSLEGWSMMALTMKICLWNFIHKLHYTHQLHVPLVLGSTEWAASSFLFTRRLELYFW